MEQYDPRAVVLQIEESRHTTGKSHHPASTQWLFVASSQREASAGLYSAARHLQGE